VPVFLDRRAILGPAAALERWASRVAPNLALGEMDFDYNGLLADAARDLAQEPSIHTTMEHVVALCVDSVRGCDEAAISVADGGDLRTLAATDDSLVVMDQLQLTLGEGPTMDVLRTLPHREPVVCPRLADGDRWPRWSRRVVEESGHAALLSFCLFASEGSSGTLVLYSRSQDAFDQEDLLEGQVLAGHASVALAAQLKEHQLSQALETRTVIGQATGILIERFGVTPDQAFAVMRRVSQNHNVKLHVLAEHLVNTGVLLDPARPDRPGRQHAPGETDVVAHSDRAAQRTQARQSGGSGQSRQEATVEATDAPPS
jgi:hypothetical protein